LEDEIVRSVFHESVLVAVCLSSIRLFYITDGRTLLCFSRRYLCTSCFV